MKGKMTGISLLVIVLILAVVVTVVKGYGMDMGGFDVEIGEGEYQEDNQEDNPESLNEVQPPWEQQLQEPFVQEQYWQEPFAQEQYWQEPIQQESLLPAEQIWQEAPDMPDKAPTPLSSAPVLTPTPLPSTPALTPTPLPTPTQTSPPALTQSAVFDQTKKDGAAGEKVIFAYYKDGKRKAEVNRYRKNYTVEFVHNKEVLKGQYPEIEVRSKGSVQICSLRLNGIECPWSWKKNTIVIHTKAGKGDNRIELLAFSQEGKLIRMEPWTF